MLDIMKSCDYSVPVLLKIPVRKIRSFKILCTKLVLEGDEGDSLYT